ncbi:Uncharacterized protein ChrSV_3839 [Chromobacterium vaccinii]|nr:Uncharacterized protein ChrSW_3839 [Chromobacterium vaccinii]QND91296.1 Uncharacterized protein ChrSV_3839 [Chromobacterium vaccinii]
MNDSKFVCFGIVFYMSFIFRISFQPAGLADSLLFFCEEEASGRGDGCRSGPVR